MAALLVCSAAAPACAAVDDPGSSVARFSVILARAGSPLPDTGRRELARRILLLASYYRLDARLLIALVSTESAWRPNAVSSVGAQGLGQLMPGTAKSLDVDALETYENLDGTARYLRRMIDHAPASALRDRYRLALAAYNAGPGAVQRYHGIPPYAETQNYVATVMARYDAFCRAVPDVEPFATDVPRRTVAPTPPTTRAPVALDVVTLPIAPPRPALALVAIAAFAAQPAPYVAIVQQTRPFSTAFERFRILRGDATK